MCVYNIMKEYVLRFSEIIELLKQKDQDNIQILNILVAALRLSDIIEPTNEWLMYGNNEYFGLLLRPRKSSDNAKHNLC